MHRNNFRRRQKRLESRLDETVRIASIVQKGMATGRSSYVEMRALDRLISHNVRQKVRALNLQDDIAAKIQQGVSSGYVDVLTPNGKVREKELDKLLSLDSDIVTCIGIIESGEMQVVGMLQELVEERKKLVGSLKA